MSKSATAVVVEPTSVTEPFDKSTVYNEEIVAKSELKAYIVPVLSSQDNPNHK